MMVRNEQAVFTKAAVDTGPSGISNNDKHVTTLLQVYFAEVIQTPHHYNDASLTYCVYLHSTWWSV